MNAFAIATRRRLREVLHETRAELLRTPRIDQERNAEEFLKRSHLLGLLVAGASAAGESILLGVVGYGSEVEVTDLTTGVRSRHRLMSGEGMLLEAGHVSVESPMGRALLGSRPGDIVHVASPGGERALRLDRLQTLDALLDDWASETTPDRAARVRTGTDG